MHATARDLIRIVAAMAVSACTASSSDSPSEPDEAKLDRPVRRPADGGTDASARSGDASSGADAGDAPSGSGSGGTGGAIGASVPLPGCAACRVHVPPSYPSAKRPAPVLVAFHGDEGPSWGVPNIISLWTSAADAHGYIVLGVACGPEIGCTDGNFSNWLDAQGYAIGAKNIASIDGFVTQIESLYDVDTKREYLAGYSGGAYVLGYFAQARAEHYAAVAFIAGGMPAWSGTGHACPTRKIGAYFLGGDGDPRTGGQMSDTASAFQACGEEIRLDLVAGADHGATIASIGTGRGEAISTWFDAHSLP
jgi:hypothetical protein